jgi:ribonuclease D
VAEYLSAQQVIGFDTETRPSFKKGVVNKVSLLQLATPNDAFLIRVNKVGLPASLREIWLVRTLLNPVWPFATILKDFRNFQI